MQDTCKSRVWCWDLYAACTKHYTTISDDQLCSDLSEVLVGIGVEQTPLSCRDLSLKDDALTGANQDGSCAGLIAQQFVPADALDEVASPARQTAHLLCVPVEVQTLTGGHADQ